MTIKFKANVLPRSVFEKKEIVLVKMVKVMGVDDDDDDDDDDD